MKTVKCTTMTELNEAIKERVNLDLRGWGGGDIYLKDARAGDINMRNATTGDVYLQGATAGYIDLRVEKAGDIDLRGVKAGYIDLEGAKVRNVYLQVAEAGDIDFRGATTGNVYLQGAKAGTIYMRNATGDIKQNYTAEDLDFLRKLPLEIIDMKQWQSNDNWLTAENIHTCGTTYCVRGYAQAQYFAKNGVKLYDLESLYPNLKHLFFMTNEQFKYELNKILY